MKPHRIAALTAFTNLLLATSAYSAVTVTFTESGPNVVATFSGSIDSRGRVATTDSLPFHSILAPVGDWFGGNFDADGADVAPMDIHIITEVVFTPVTGFGTGDQNSDGKATPGSDPFLAGAIMNENEILLAVPLNYQSGDPLRGEVTWANASFSTLGLTPGTYTASWPGHDQGVLEGIPDYPDSVTFQIGSVSAVPEPGSSVALAGLLAAGLFIRQRRSLTD